MILYVNKVVRAGDRFERMVCQVLIAGDRGILEEHNTRG